MHATVGEQHQGQERGRGLSARATVQRQSTRMCQLVKERRCTEYKSDLRLFTTLYYRACATRRPRLACSVGEEKLVCRCSRWRGAEHVSAQLIGYHTSVSRYPLSQASDRARSPSSAALLPHATTRTRPPSLPHERVRALALLCRDAPQHPRSSNRNVSTSSRGLHARCSARSPAV